MIIAFCNNCSLVFEAKGVMGGTGLGPNIEIMIQSSGTSCPRCGEMAEIQNSTMRNGQVWPSGGNSVEAEHAFLMFQLHVIDQIKSIRVNEWQAKRFAVAVAKNDTKSMKRSAAAISRSVSKVLKEADKTKDPDSARKWLGKVLRFFGAASALGATFYAFVAGANQSIELIEKLNGDKPIHEIIEEYREKYMQDQGDQNPEKIGNEQRERKPVEKPPKSTEV